MILRVPLPTAPAEPPAPAEGAPACAPSLPPLPALARPPLPPGCPAPLAPLEADGPPPAPPLPAPIVYLAPPAVVAPPHRRARWLAVLGLVLLGAAVGAALALGQ
jgi:hypothetical protein